MSIFKWYIWTVTPMSFIEFLVFALKTSCLLVKYIIPIS